MLHQDILVVEDAAAGGAIPQAAAPHGGTPHGIELRHLWYFVAVANAGTFTHAAEQMFIAQPTLSQQIRRLEEWSALPCCSAAGKASG